MFLITYNPVFFLFFLMHHQLTTLRDELRTRLAGMVFPIEKWRKKSSQGMLGNTRGQVDFPASYVNFPGSAHWKIPDFRMNLSFGVSYPRENQVGIFQLANS